MKDTLNKVTDIFDLGGGDDDGMELRIITCVVILRGRSELIIGGETTVMDGKIFFTPHKGSLYDPLLISKTE
jgi:hypothetical protein